VLLEVTRDVTLAGGDNHLTWTLDVDHPPRWWPRRLGEQPRCDVEVVVEVGGEPSDRRVLRTAFREVRWRHWQLHVNGERLFVMGSNQGPTRMELGEASPEELAGDVQLALDANLDLLRLHAHVSRPELYDAADAAGLLLWQDFPLQWGYALGVRKPAVRQARAMVDLLGHHPSVVLWCAHNEPLAIDIMPGEPLTTSAKMRAGASMFLPSWNKNVLDRSLTRALHRADPSRAVDPHSGVLPGLGSPGTDSHFYFGWYHGTLDGLASAIRAVPRLGRFVTEFGAQAVPESAAFMEPERWPALDWDRLLAHHACQKQVFDRHVSPDDYATFDEWRTATQEYQSALVQLQVEDLRRLKYAPTGGFCHFCFADGYPAVTWSVLDHARVEKRGYATLRDACRPVLPMIEPRAGLVHVASEKRDVLDGAIIEVAGDARRLARFSGDIDADAVTYVGRVDLDGVGEAAVTLEHPALGRIENRYGPRLLESVRNGGRR
jgi:beta-mannosidase